MTAGGKRRLLHAASFVPIEHKEFIMKKLLNSLIGAVALSAMLPAFAGPDWQAIEQARKNKRTQVAQTENPHLKKNALRSVSCCRSTTARVRKQRRT